MGSKLQQFALQWQNYQAHFAELCFQLLETESMVDVTLCVEGQHLNAHRIVLSACSSYFQDILADSNESHPYISLSEMSFEDVKYILEFVYRGEINLTKDRFTSVLKTAEDLRINGLMEVGNYWPDFSKEEKEMTLEVWDAKIEEPEATSASTQNVDVFVNNIDDICVQSALIEPQEVQESVEVSFTTEKDKVSEKSKKRKKEHSKREYTETALAAALEELKTGRPLLEVASAHHIPRSTLYVRARSQNIPVVASRQDHSEEKIKAAVQAVTGGASFQQASRQYKIPKTVLWRRVRKEVGNYSANKRAKRKESSGFEKKKAAVLALERGENLSKVSLQYQISRTTLFREKSRLVESGKLPWSSVKRRQTDSDCFKEHRLNEAVAACREGKMSQASASQRFQVPKTTIWRRLKDVKSQNTVTTDLNKTKDVETSSETESGPSSAHVQEQPVFTFSEVSSHIPVTYIDDTDFTNSPLIILASDEGSEIALQESNHLILGDDSSTTQPENEVVESSIEESVCIPKKTS